MVAEEPEPVGQVAVVGGDHAALTGGDVLRRREAEHRGAAEPAHRSAAVRRPVCFGGILDEQDAGLIGDGREAVQVGRLAAVVDGHDGLGGGRDPAGHVGGVEVEGVGLYVGEDGRGAHVQHRGRGRDEGHGRHDHLVARADAEAEVDAGEGHRAAGEGDGMVDLVGLGEGVLEGERGWAVGEDPRAEDLRDGRQLVVADIGSGETDAHGIGCGWRVHEPGQRRRRSSGAPPSSRPRSTAAIRGAACPSQPSGRVATQSPARAVRAAVTMRA